MARELPDTSSEIHSSSLLIIITILFVILISCISAESAGIKNWKNRDSLKNDIGIRNSSIWHHCPQGWTLYSNRCYKVTQAALSWDQAQALCKSFGGNLVKISSLCEQDWVSQFVKEQLDESKTASNVDDVDVSTVSAWIGFVRLTDELYQWSSGQPAVEKDGFWAVDGLQLSQANPSTKLCCDLKTDLADSKTLRWHLTSCEDLHSSVCELKACEENSIFCADGTKCISRTWLCDGYWDCMDGSDEKDCQISASVSSSSSLASQHCGGALRNASGTFHSPNFPDKYPPFLKCVWKIETLPPSIVEITVQSLNIEEKYDYLKVYDGTEMSANQLLMSLEGNVSNVTVRSTGSLATLLFATDHSVEAKGFNLTWKSVVPKPCGEDLSSGDIEKELHFPHTEVEVSDSVGSPQQTCDWLLSSDSSQELLSLQFRTITLLRQDYITVYDGKESSAPVLIHINSTHNASVPSAQQDFSTSAIAASISFPPVITSSGQYFLLRLVTTKGSSSRFVASFKSGCDTVISSSSSLILSPGFSSSIYPNDLNCTWQVARNRTGLMLTLLFLPHFFTEAGKDYVQVYGSETGLQAPLLMNQSGPMFHHDEGISSHQGFFIRFVSDSTINHGRWAAVISYDCDTLSVLSPLMPNVTRSRFGTSVRFSCPEGFSIDGPASTVCGVEGQWKPSDLPTCKELDCGSVPIPPYAYLTAVSGTTFGNLAYYQCFYGYYMIGSRTATCGTSGWENIPSCEAITCPKEPPPDGGTARAEELIYGYQREYFCKSSLHLIGSKFSHCNLSGIWTDEVPVCETLQCPAINGIKNGHLNTTLPVPVGTSVELLCDEGFEPSGLAILTCMPDIKFDHVLPACIDANECATPGNCGSHLCQNYYGDFTCQCQQGYQHPNNSRHLCIDIDECKVNNGGCSHTCVNLPGDVKCDCPDNTTLYTGPYDQIGEATLVLGKTCIGVCQPLNVTGDIKVIYRQKSIFTGELLAGTEAVVACPTGFYPNSRTSVISCVAGKGWSASVTHCIAHRCTVPRDIVNGHVSFTGLGLGDSVRYECDPGYVLRGSALQFCIRQMTQDGELVMQNWSGQDPICDAVSCPDPVPPKNGNVDFSSTRFSSVAIYRCQCGYQLIGDSVTKCKADGNWSHTPVCKVKFCTHPGIPKNAKLTYFETGFSVGSMVKYQCTKIGHQLSDLNPLQCLPQKESKKSVLLPYKDLIIMFQVISSDNHSLQPTCVQSLDISRLLKIWSEEMVRNCQGSVEVVIGENNTTIINASTLNITVHFHMSSNNTSGTCVCVGEVQKYMQTLNSDSNSSMTTVNVSTDCPAVKVKPGSVSVISEKWQCFAGLRLELPKDVRCDRGSSVKCWEDCIDGSSGTLDTRQIVADSDDSPFPSTVVTNSATTEGETTEDSESSTQITFTSAMPLLWSSTVPPTIMPIVDTSTREMTTRSVVKGSELHHFSTTPKVSSIDAMLDSYQLKTTASTFTSHTLTTDISSSKPTTTSSGLHTTEFSTKGLGHESLTFGSEVTTQRTIEPSSSTSAKMKVTTSLPLATTGRSSAVSTEQPVPAVSQSRPPWVTSRQPPQPKSKARSTTRASSFTSAIQNDPTFTHTKFPTSPATPRHSGTDEEFFGTNSPRDEFWREGHDGNEMFSESDTFDTVGKDNQQKPAFRNCTAIRHQNSSHNQQPDTTSKWTDDNSLNISDCLMTHTLEKQDITVVQGSAMPRVDLTAPALSVEVHDRMSGGFNNISCIDAVHININAKVNELLREFGSLVCVDAPDSSLELAAGNIRFKGTRARIFIKFLITYSLSSKSNVESCAREFRNYASVQLPKKFERVQQAVQPSECTFVNYTKKEFNISMLGWACRNGYQLDEQAFQCFHQVKGGISTLTQSGVPAIFSSPTPVLTIPRLSMLFVGAFTSSQSPYEVDQACIYEYTAGLIKALSQIEPHLQSKYFLCKDIYMDVTRNVSVTKNNRRIIAEATVHLMPLKDTVDLTSMSSCAKFISLHFREPSQHLRSVTLTNEYLPTCPSITLTPHGLRSDINEISFYCPHGYSISDANFKCISENLPLHATGIEVEVTGKFEGVACEDEVHDASNKFIKEVISSIRLKLTSGGLCSSLGTIIILQQQGDVVIKKFQITILIPVTLVSLSRSQNNTTVCTKQVYQHLSSSLSNPITAMISTISPKCGGPIMPPGDYTVAFTRWECFRQLVYNPDKHQCEPLSTQSVPTQTKGLRTSNRHKRDVGHYLLPQWNASLPTCADREPPQFHGCPDRPIVWTVNHLGQVPGVLSWPTATDSSGIEPVISVTPDLEMLYNLKQNTTFVVTAGDTAGNTATCTIVVIVNDNIPPHITCPPQLVTILDPASEKNLRLTYKNVNVRASDNNGTPSLKFDPPEGAIVRATDIILVTAQAVDAHNNVANCSFFATVRSQRCQEWSLPHSVGVIRTCSYAGNNQQGLSCAVSCAEGKGFAVQPPEQYVCQGDWKPHDRVPQCVDSRFPDFELHLSFDLTYNGDTSEGCPNKTQKAIQDAVRPKILTVCQNASQDLFKINMHSVGTFSQGLRNKLTTKIMITIQSTPGTKAARWCGKQVLSQLQFNETLDRPCGRISLNNPTEMSGEESCPEGFAIKNGMCYQCPPGSYWVRPQCQSCPSDIKPDTPEYTACVLGSHSQDCPAQQYKTKPKCAECPKGTFQNAPGSTECMSCVQGYTTASAGSKQENECRAPCGKNTYSATGLQPCLPCPVAFYQEQPGSRSCNTCAIYRDDRSAHHGNPHHRGHEHGDHGQGDQESEGQEHGGHGNGGQESEGQEHGGHGNRGQESEGQEHGSRDHGGQEQGVHEHSQSHYCEGICEVGHFSDTGRAPCQTCPHNYYNPYRGENTCFECERTKITRKTGSTSSIHCVDAYPCRGNPCKHRGRCRPKGRGFTCVCTPGYKGDTCRDKVDVCGSQPCKNNGICLKHGQSFRCHCLSGFSGQDCGIKMAPQETVDHCASSPCVFGTCINSPSFYQCHCQKGYEGGRCEINTDDCAGVTCQNNGVCVDLVDAFYCSCVGDFYGVYCEHSFDDCQMNYCLNGGTCVDGNKSFSCSCPQGFQGQMCEIDVNECAQAPCSNGALCQDGINSFTCVCAPGFTGKGCDSVIDVCLPNPCLHEGECVNTVVTQSGFICHCPEGYTGMRCEQDIDECNPLPCHANGTLSCENKINDFKCNCLPGWTGQLCSEREDPCHDQPCDNGAKCVKNGQTFTCLCHSPYIGPTCSTMIQHCTSHPCHNKGTCMESTTSFSCQCAPGFTGKHCEVNIDECKSQPCHHGGVCQDGVDAFSCQCHQGFAGEKCEIDIDECLSHPCLHDSDCIQMDGSFRCNCSAGYTGKLCETEIDKCSSNPCQHGGQCIDKLADFDCLCPQGYIGATCEQINVECLDESLCLNGGSCHRINGEDVCICTPYFSGPDCGKEKSSNFDLDFHRNHGSIYISSLRVGNLSELSLCLWVKFSQSDTKGTYLSLIMSDRKSSLLTLSGSHAKSPLFISGDIVIHTNDGQWHYLCWVFNSTIWLVYRDGEIFLKGKAKEWAMENSIILGLGQVDNLSVDDEDDDDNSSNNSDKSDKTEGRFRGHLHLVNIYSRFLEPEEILNMSQHCQSSQFGGDIFNWVLAESHVTGDVDIVKPSQCGQTVCAQDGEDSLCMTVTEVDKISPVATQCPGVVVMTGEESPVPVMWTEPEFSDNVGIVLVKQNFRPGQAFPHGQYLVTYIGYDGSNNSAECSFNVFVRKFDCIDPPPPANGARVCGEWEHGRYCIPSCTPKYRFVTPVPPFYRCGQEGVWNPFTGEPFAFPACARMYPPAHTIYGGISFEGPGCTDTFQHQLHEKLVRIMTQLNKVLGLCPPDQICDYTKGLNVECGEENQSRKKRAVNNAASLYKVKMNISMPAAVSPNLATGDVISQIVHTIKHDPTEKEFVLASVDIQASPHCQAGHMLTNANGPICLECPIGHYLSNKSVCSPCPRGWYSDKPKQTACLPCDDGFITRKEGASSVTQCLLICDIGKYFNVVMGQCENCLIGQYQDKSGEFSCSACPVGLTTIHDGASSMNDCLDPCGAGEEVGISGTCIPCPMGTYSNGKGPETFCVPCPRGWTTDGLGAVDASQCAIEKCQKGFYQNVQDKSCHPCPLGTFQPLSGATACEPCGVGLTTEQEGADNASLCKHGKVNECELKIDSCGKNANCVDQDVGYKCECRYGKTNAGACVDICERICNKLRICNDDDGDDEEIKLDCQCEADICKDNAVTNDKLYQSLIIACITVASVVTLVLLIIIVIYIHRKKQQFKQTEHVRVYREEREFVAFTNEAFDSLPGQSETERDSQSLQLPTRMATRWHSQSFMSPMPPHDDDTESTEL